ncbi:sensor histidine kinase [Streptacidiphilus anmyonensis]|uniref:sensor histidine kinase n=1 Tax=Streptacidiphilus anmyonensis TaxID=405782 RepID=UPI0005A627A8|nr:histidine kinase [Streptacidiphilus anmyonensis]
MTSAIDRLIIQSRLEEPDLPGGEPEDPSIVVLGNLERVAPPRWAASSLVPTVVTCYLIMGVTNLVFYGLTRDQIIIGGFCFLGIAALQVLHSDPRLERWRRLAFPYSLVLQALFTYLPPFAFGIWWGGMSGFLIASALLLLSPRLGWAVFGGVVGATLFSGVVDHWTTDYTVYMTISIIVTGLVVWGLTRLSLLVVQIQATQGELARVAVVRERLRFARDLHDLLGYSLSTIVLKSELTKRLVDGSPADALTELDDILLVSRQALTDVRAVSRGYREMSLFEEAEAARSVLEAAGIRADVDLTVRPPRGHLDTILATVLREAITNLLRHSKAESCVIAARAEGDRIRLTIANDGVTRSDAPRGSGLQNLTARLAQVDGRLSWSVEDDGWFVLCAVAKLPPVAEE